MKVKRKPETKSQVYQVCAKWDKTFQVIRTRQNLEEGLQALIETRKALGTTKVVLRICSTVHLDI
jgi:hypothetical protein